jgi:type IX secretion system substrate protein/carboxypeptidase family protein
MKDMKTFVRNQSILLLLTFFLSSFAASADNSFTFDGGNTGEAQWQIWIYGATLPNGVSFEADDQIAVYDGATMVGLITLTVSPTESNWTQSGLVAYSVLEDGSDGFTGGHTATIKAWDASADVVYTLSNWNFHPDWYQSHSAETFPGDASAAGWGYSYVSFTPAPQFGDLHGTVTISGGGAIEGATVTIVGQDIDATTSSVGYYEFIDLPVGSYTVTIYKATYETNSQTVSITDGNTTVHDVALTSFSNHYSFIGGNAADSVWTLYVQSAKIDGVDLDAQDEIVVYDNNTMVGHFTLTQICTATNKLNNDLVAFASLNNGTNGWDEGHDYTFKAWDASAGAEYTSTTVTLGGEYTGDYFPSSFDTYSFLTVAFTTPNGQISGTHDVIGGIVRATNTVTSTLYTVTITGVNYTINVPPGTYTVTSVAESYEGYTAPGNPYTVTSGVTTTVNISMDPLPTGITQNISLVAGYQFVSRNVQPADVDMDAMVHSEITANLDFIRAKEETYDYVSPNNRINGIGDWEKEEGYLFRMTGDDVLSITGYQIDQAITPIDLVSGHQFISYLPTFTMDIQTALTDILDNLDWAKNSTGHKLRKIGGTWVNNIGDVGPGEGIQVKMTGVDQLIYTSIEPAMRGGNSQLELQYFKFIGGNAAANMYRIYLKGTGNEFEIGDEIAAFDGETMVGAMVYQNLTDVYDNDLNIFSVTNLGPGYTVGNPIVLKAWDASENKVYSLTYEFKSVYGNEYLEMVYPAGDNHYSIADIAKNTFGISENLEKAIHVYPNPASGLLNILVPFADGDVQIVDLLGKTVYSEKLTAEKMQINTENFETGIYIIKINSAYGIVNKKLMIR